MINIFMKLFDTLKDNKNNLIPKIFLIIILVILTEIIIMIRPVGTLYTPKTMGEVIDKDIIAINDLKFIDEKASTKAKETITAEFAPIFRLDKAISENAKNTIINIFAELPLNTANNDEICKVFDKNLIAISISELELLKKIIKKSPNFTQDFASMYTSYAHKGILKKEVIISLNNPQKIKIISNNNDIILETFYENTEYEKFYIKNNDLLQDINNQFPTLNNDERYVLLTFFNKSLIANIIYDRELTENELNNKIKNEGTIYKTLKKGQVIARKGDILTESNILEINALNNYATDPFSIKRILETFFLIVCIIIFSIYFIKLSRVNIFNHIENLIFFCITFLVYVIAINLPMHFNYSSSSIYFGLFIPISALSLTFVFLFSKSTSIFLTIILSIIFLTISNDNVPSFLFVFFSGLSSLFQLNKITKRSQLLFHGLITSAINILIALFVIVFVGFSNVNIIQFIIGAALNGIVSAILALGCISIGELCLNTPTVFRLQELCDLSTPLMRELSIHANGTYNHSLSTATIAEQAANDIGANGILTRVAAYYHDTGKLDNPEYFTENQQNGYNIHDELKPSMSATIIKSHVKKSIEKAQEAKLPRKVIEIITQHHGDGIIKFFYNKALEQSDATKEGLSDVVYRYPGPKPQFIESAILMLADQVEAASHSLVNPTQISIEKKVNQIIDSNYESGMLDDSGLTLKEISKIKTTFTTILTGMYHSRIAYPEKLAEKNEDKNKSTDQNQQKQVNNEKQN